MWSLELLFIALCLQNSIAGDSKTFYHDLSPEDRRYYFGISEATEVPAYEYIARPEPVILDGGNSYEADHLDFVIEVFGIVSHLKLERNHRLISPGCLVEYRGTSGPSHVIPCNSEHLGCFYSGSVDNDTSSSAAVTVCDGFHGVIETNGTTIVIQPIHPSHVARVRRDTLLSDPHIVHLRAATFHDSFITPDVTFSRQRRQASNDRYIDSVLVVDPNSHRFHGNDTERVVKTIFNIAAQRFLDPSLGVKIYMTLNKIVILETEQVGFELSGYATGILDTFCEWQKDQNVPGLTHKADYVALIARMEFVEKSIPSGMTGLARKGMCNPRYSCSIVKDDGLHSGLTLAHETGHVLGLDHDGNNNNCPPGLNIMSPSGGGGHTAQKWSNCSASQLKEFLSKPEAECLLDPPQGGALKSGRVLPGSIYTADDQCRLTYGPHWTFYDKRSGSSKNCDELTCLNPTRDRGYASTTPVFDGTDCARSAGERKWCIQGTCVDMGAVTIDPVDGGWSPWSEPTQCSRTCGGGIKTRLRTCDYPVPMYGGRDCQGMHEEAQLCNMHDCEKSPHDFRQEQCQQKDASLTSPLGPIPSFMACRLLCQGSKTIMAPRGRNIDGTDCKLDSNSAPFTKCVSGQCLPFGCDGKSNSGLMTDRCGVCNGNSDTCVIHTGTSSAGDLQAFKTFVTIPAGSTSVTVRQTNRYCYLGAVMNGRRIFPPGSGQAPSGTSRVFGMTFTYTRLTEKLYITGPLPDPVELQVYMQWTGYHPDISYEYAVPIPGKRPDYMWKTRAGPCSATCGTGARHHIVTCVDARAIDVDPINCDITIMPAEHLEQCHVEDCPPLFEWRTGPWGTCSQTCGGGLKTRPLTCLRTDTPNAQEVSADHCSSLTRPVDQLNCGTETCAYWRTSLWTRCSVSCGNGVKARNVWCFNEQGVHVGDSECLIFNKPSRTEHCIVRSCSEDSSCVDESSDCAAYGSSICQQYVQWAKINCNKFCGYCAAGSRKRRDAEVPVPELHDPVIDIMRDEVLILGDVPEEIHGDHPSSTPSSPAIDRPVDIAELFDEIQLDPLDNELHATPMPADVPDNLLAVENVDTGEDLNNVDIQKVVTFDIISTTSIPGDILNMPDIDIPAPKLPLCNGVYKDLSGGWNITGSLDSGTICQHVIALPLQNRVLIHLTGLDFDCKQGDEMYIIDGVSGQKIQVCSFLPDREWLSAGSIVHVIFTPAKPRHGYSLRYQAYPSNTSVTACSALFTDVNGHISNKVRKNTAAEKGMSSWDVTSRKTSSTDGMSQEECQIYIVATPGHKIEITLELDIMNTEASCQTSNSLMIEDFSEDPDEELFCGTRKPFIWESRGSRVRLRYNRTVTGEFEATYSVGG